MLVSALLATLATLAAQSGELRAASDPVIAAAGDYGCDPGEAHYNGGNGSLNPDTCQEKLTSDQLVAGNFAAVLALGDQHWCGSLAEYQQAYDPTWGRLKSITHPVPGNHEYITEGTTYPTVGCDSTNAGAAGYFGYFGAAARPQGQSWYSYDVGAWHLIALNSNCDNVGCGAGSTQATWLASDLAGHPNQCILAYFHTPVFSSGGRASPNGAYFWQLLYAAHADVVLDGHDHIYERFAPQNPAGVADPDGITEFIVGTGGANHTSIAAIAANSVVRDTTSFGILALTLHPNGYSWAFKPGLGSFTDSGSAVCNYARSSDPSASAGASATPTPAPTPTPTATATATATPGGSTFVPTADSYVDGSNPTVNYGNATSLRVDGSPVVRSYLRFSVSGLIGSVTKATLRIYANSLQSTGFDVSGVADGSWTETGITAANAPPFGSALGSSGPVTQAGSWKSVEVTSFVRGNGTFGFGLATTSATALSLSSRTGAYPPQLVISTSSSSPTPTLAPTPTATPTSKPSASSTPTPTAVPTGTPRPTSTPTATLTPSPKSTPSVSPAPTPSIATLAPVADAYVDAAQPATNFGKSAALRVRKSVAQMSYLKFDLSGVSGHVSSAVLRVYSNSAQSIGFDVYQVANTSWGDTAITYANAPPLGTRLGSSGPVTAGAWYSVDVTSAVGGGLVSLGLWTASTTSLNLSSCQGTNPPRLVVTTTGTAGGAFVASGPGEAQPELLLVVCLAAIALSGWQVLRSTRFGRALRPSSLPARRGMARV